MLSRTQQWYYFRILSIFLLHSKFFENYDYLISILCPIIFLIQLLKVSLKYNPLKNILIFIKI